MLYLCMFCLLKFRSNSEKIIDLFCENLRGGLENPNANHAETLFFCHLENFSIYREVRIIRGNLYSRMTKIIIFARI